MALKLTETMALPNLVDAELADGMGDPHSGAWRAEYCRYRQHLEETWAEILAAYHEWRQQMLTSGALASEWDHSGAATGVVIYGLTGSTRWYVRGDGSIFFSAGHAYPESALGQRKIASALRLGFGVTS